MIALCAALFVAVLLVGVLLVVSGSRGIAMLDARGDLRAARSRCAAYREALEEVRRHERDPGLRDMAADVLRLFEEDEKA